jgi:putative membrane protein
MGPKGGGRVGRVGSANVQDVAADVDPDARFLLANERTLLAWIRTSVTLQAGGVGVLHFADAIVLNEMIGLGLLLIGACAGLTGYSRYRTADRAIRQGVLPPSSVAPEAIVLAVVLLAVLLIAVAVSGQLG